MKLIESLENGEAGLDDPLAFRVGLPVVDFGFQQRQEVAFVGLVGEGGFLGKATVGSRTRFR